MNNSYSNLLEMHVFFVKIIYLLLIFFFWFECIQLYICSHTRKAGFYIDSKLCKAVPDEGHWETERGSSRSRAEASIRPERE